MSYVFQVQCFFFYFVFFLFHEFLHRIKICDTDTSKETGHQFFEVFRILGNPEKIDYTIKIWVKCKPRTRNCSQQQEHFDVLAPRFIFSRARRFNRATAECCRSVLDISSGHIAAESRNSTRANRSL